MNIAIDIGNTHTKTGIFEAQNMLKTGTFDSLNPESLKFEVREYKDKIEGVIISTVVGLDQEFIGYLKDDFRMMIFTSSCPIPIINLYHSPLSLGMDRLAAIIGSKVYYPSKNILVIDAGTCITYDFINENNEYLGGAISPGIRMRFKALNNYTDKLPLVETIEENNLIGRNTLESIKSGVLNGVIAEVSSIIERYRWLYPELKVIITGGDSAFFAINLKFDIFAAPHLVLEGLNEVLIFNQTDKFHNDK